MKIFLGGTCNSTWRKEFIEFLQYEKINYFDPVVEGDWTIEDEKEGTVQKNLCDILLWVITPRMRGFYSPFEIADLANSHANKLWVCFLKHDKDNNNVIHSWTVNQRRSIISIQNRLLEKKVKVFNDIYEVHQQVRIYKENILSKVLVEK